MKIVLIGTFPAAVAALLWMHASIVAFGSATASTKQEMMEDETLEGALDPPLIGSDPSGGMKLLGDNPLPGSSATESLSNQSNGASQHGFVPMQLKDGDALVQGASIQSFKGRATETAAALEAEFLQAQLSGDKVEIVNAAANTIRGTASVLEEAKVESKAIVAQIQEQAAVPEHSGWAAHMIDAFNSATTQFNRALEYLPLMTKQLEDVSQELQEEESKHAATAHPNWKLQQSSISSPDDRTCGASNEDEELSARIRHHKREAARHKRALHRNFAVNPRAKLHLERTDKIHSSIEKGDHGALNQHLSSVHSRFLARSGGASRRGLEAASRRRLQESVQGPIKIRQNNECMNVDCATIANGCNVSIKPCSTTDTSNQKFEYETNTERVKLVDTNFCLDVNADGNLKVWECQDANNNQKWWLDDYSRLQSKRSDQANKCVDMSNNNNQNLYMGTCHDESNQKFTVPHNFFGDFKATQCKLLMDCVGQMAIYDMILYFYSDDIDPNSGDIDGNVFRHDTAPDIYSVYNSADVAKARDEYPNERETSWYSDQGHTDEGQWCDNTLQRFYRNVEFDRVPHWEGATVAEVCLAQGSHTYVKLSEIATKIGFQSADEIARDMFDCSKDLYDSNINPRMSPFPFSRSRHKLGFDAKASIIGEALVYPEAEADNKYRLLDNNEGSSWKAREEKYGPAQELWNYKSNKWVDASSSNVYGQPDEDTDNQRWFYYPSEEQIRVLSHPSKCLTAPSSGEGYLTMDDCDVNSDYQKWYKPAEKRFKNRARNRCMRMASSSDHKVYIDSHQNTCGSDGEWLLQLEDDNSWWSPTQPDVTFKLQFGQFSRLEDASQRGTCVDWDSSDGVHLRDCSGDPSQMWMYDGSSKEVRSMKDQEYCLDIHTVTGGSGQRAKVRLCNEESRQQWERHGTYGLKNLAVNLCLASRSGNDYGLLDCNDSNSQQFLMLDNWFGGAFSKLEFTGVNGKTFIEWMGHDFDPEDPNAVGRNYVNSELRQLWQYEEDTKRIRNRSASNPRCLELKADLMHVRVYHCNDSDNQKWVRWGKAGIKNVATGKCLQTGSENKVQTSSCSDSNSRNQLKWDEGWFGGSLVNQIEFKWKDGSECPDSQIQMSSGGIPVFFGWADDSDAVDGILTRTAILSGTTPTLSSIDIKCTSPGPRIELYEISANGLSAGRQLGSIPPVQGMTFEDSFVVPSGIETDHSRNEFGQVIDAGKMLYTYDRGLVEADLSTLRDDLVGTYRWIWDEWLRNGDNTREVELRGEYPDPNDATDYQEADSYMGLLGKAEDDDVLEEEMIKGHARHKGKSTSDMDAREKEWNAFNRDIEKRYKAVQDGFNLVFGKEASVGYVCGIESAVAAGGADWFPGTCCLDAPFQNPEGEWGREFDCAMTCQNKAPFFNGLSEESCSAVGGTWCPTPTDCTVLKECVDDEIDAAESGNKTAYAAYLRPGRVTDPLDFHSCADSTEYFGFDALYKNYEDICENIKQLHHTKDFEFLDEVYAQGSPLVEVNIPFAWPSLTDPDTGTSQSNIVQDGPWKEGLLFGFGLLRDVIEIAKEAVNDQKCGILVAAGNGENIICSGVNNIYTTLMGVVVQAMNLAHTSWEYAHGVTCEVSNIEPQEDHEILQVQHQNHKKIYEGLEATYDYIDNSVGPSLKLDLLGTGHGSDTGKLGEILDAVNENCGTTGGSRALMSSSESSARNAGCDGKDQDHDGIVDNCEEDQFAPWLDVPNGVELEDHEGIKHVQGKLFPSIERAVASLRGALTVLDDCAAKEDLTLDLKIQEANECQAVISATPLYWCRGMTNVGKKETFSVAVDTKAPTIRCGFQHSTTPDKKILYVEEGEDFFDSGLSLDVIDTCSEKVAVEAFVSSNELDATGSSALLALAREEGANTSIPELWLNQATCASPVKKGFCNKSPIGVRVYEVVVEATDTAGWSATDTCHVVVAPNQNREERELLQDSTPSMEELAKLVEHAGALRRLEYIQYQHYL